MLSPFRPIISASGPEPNGVCCAWLYWSEFILHISWAISVGDVVARHGPFHVLGFWGSPEVGEAADASGTSILHKPLPTLLCSMRPNLPFIFLIHSLYSRRFICLFILDRFRPSKFGCSKSGDLSITIASARSSRYDAHSSWCFVWRSLSVLYADLWALRMSLSVLMTGVSSGIPPSIRLFKLSFGVWEIPGLF